MTNTYRALSKAAEAAYAPGVFEHDFTPMDEKDALDSGLIELVPRTYKVLSNNFSAGPQDSEISATFRKEIEQALIDGGHIERVDAAVAEPAPAPVADVPVDEPLVNDTGSKTSKK